MDASNHIKIVQELERDEALRLRPYNDGKGKLTIGIGRNLTDNGISREEAYQMLNHDLERVYAELDQRFPWWQKLDSVRQRVLVNMNFNMGIKKFSGFVKTLALVQAGRYAEAADEMLRSDWQIDVGPRAIRLSDMMRRGV